MDNENSSKQRQPQVGLGKGKEKKKSMRQPLLHASQNIPLIKDSKVGRLQSHSVGAPTVCLFSKKQDIHQYEITTLSIDTPKSYGAGMRRLGHPVDLITYRHGYIASPVRIKTCYNSDV